MEIAFVEHGAEVRHDVAMARTVAARRQNHVWVRLVEAGEAVPSERGASRKCGVPRAGQERHPVALCIGERPVVHDHHAARGPLPTVARDLAADSRTPEQLDGLGGGEGAALVEDQ